MLEPLRSLWQGSEGICWLACVPDAARVLQNGGFYLDRVPQTKHLAGLFNTEGTYTKNSPDEVRAMLDNLEMWSYADTRPKE